MKLFLDDERDVPALITRLKELGFNENPKGWKRCLWPDEAIEILESGQVDILSLDHDLGDSQAAQAENRKERKGSTVLDWMEEQVFTRDFVPPRKIYIHSMNPDEARKMRQTAHRILKKYQEIQAQAEMAE